MTDSKSVVKAEDISHVLRDSVALLPGCRDRSGRAVLLFPSKENQVTADNIRNVLIYLHTVTSDDAREKGFVIVIDMRGKQTWNNVRHILKAINHLSEAATIHTVLIIKPDKFWEKQKAQISLGSWNFDVQMVGPEQLVKHVDVTQLPREMGGTFPYDHDDWLETRLELEKWIWQITEVMRGLELHRRSICEAETPVDVGTAEKAMNQHLSTRKAILAIPIEKIQHEANRITSRITRPASGVQNPDLLSALPHMSNLVASLLDHKDKVFKSWEKRRIDLDEMYQLKLYERDVDEMLDWVRSHGARLMERMGDIGTSEGEAVDRLKAFDEFESAARNTEVNVGQVTRSATRLVSSGTPQHRNRVERSAIRMAEEWERFQTLLLRRRVLLTTAVAFFRCASQYFTHLPSWLEHPGCDPSTIDGKDAEKLETAIATHEQFWNQVEGIYAEAVAQSSQLMQALKASETDDCHGVARDMMGRLTRSQKQLHGTWRDRQVRLHHLLALTAFQTDTQRVIEWLDEHGDPYLRKNIRIGDSLETSTQLQRNHAQFRRIAQNTYANARKLFSAINTISESGSGVLNKDRMQEMLADLKQRLDRFTERLEARNTLLSLSVLFHTHHHELLAWYAEMERKYDVSNAISDDVDECEEAKEQWVHESDGTAQAYATTMGEGTQLVNELRQNQKLLDVDYTTAIGHISQMIGFIDQTNQRLTDRWTSQRTYLHVALTFAHFMRDNREVLDQISNWEEDMRGMLASPTFLDNAGKVQPFHETNTAQVKLAIMNIKGTAKELLQAIHGNKLDDLKAKGGELVLDRIRGNLRQLDSAEHRVLKVASETADQIASAKKLNHVRFLSKQLVENFEKEAKRMNAMGCIPRTLDEANRALADHESFRKTVEGHELATNETSIAFYRYSNELIKEGIADRNIVADLNEKVVTKWRLLVGLTEERHKLLKAAVGCYKTYYSGVVPILDQLEREYSVVPVSDWCRTCPSPSAQDRTNFVSEMLSKHHEYKDRFLKGCSYAQKTSELFLKYIQKANVPKADRQHHEDMIYGMKAALRDRQSKILELWTKKKKHLDRCQQYVLVDASREQILSWMCGEGEARLALFQRHVKNMTADQAESILDDFCKYKITVKEQRATIQTFLCMVNSIIGEAEEHKTDIEKCIMEVRSRFEQFSRRVSDCETALRGGRPSNVRDELSLDRHSDNSVEERIERDRAESQLNERTRKMMEPMQELIKSERDYIEDLRRCVQIYCRDFDTAEVRPPVSIRGRRKEIFGNVEKIYEFHSEKFIHELTKYEKDPEEVVCSFTVWVDYLNELYTDYCVNKEQNNHVIALPEAMQYFASVREKHGLEMNNDLGSLLIKPVQRITRYRLMIEQLHKNCTGNLEEIREAYDVVLSIPRRVNDIIHLNCLDKEKLGVLGPFVMQDCLTVWEPRSYFKKGKERQVFLFELAIVFAKKLEMPSKTVRYVAKGKPISLGEVSVVEHVEGDVCRFGLRVGTIASNENRTDLRSATENGKIAWVRRIRELTQGLLPLGLGVGLDSGSLTTARSISTRSNVSSSSGDRLSRDAESLSMETGGNQHRHSIQSNDSEKHGADQWIISSDFEAQTDGQLAVSKGDKVEILEQQPSDAADWVQVSLVDAPGRTGLVPCSILLPDQPSSSTDRPDAASGNAVVKRKSLRRIFANSGKQQQQEAPASSQQPSQEPAACNVLSGCSTAGGSSAQTEVPVIVSPAAAAGDSVVDEEPLEGLPPPMEELSLNNSSSHTNENNGECGGDVAVRDSMEEEVPEKAEKTPEELARFKRHYVLMELVETEQDYVRDLTSVVEGYIANLDQMELPDDLRGKDKIIFANIAQILEFHKNNFCKEIEKCLDNYEAAGAAFVKYERRLHTLYVKYCQNKPKSDYLVSQDEFEVFFAETKAQLGHKVALCDLLIKPVQRIMKYQLLLKDILKFTERAKDSTVQLKKALDVMHVVPKACDDMMQVGRLQNFDGSLNAQGRLIHQGTLSIAEMVGSNVQKAKDRRIFLFEQSAIIADHILPKKEFGNPIYIFKNQIMVNKMQFQKSICADEPMKFSIGSTDPTQPNLIAIAQTQEEKDEWIRKLDNMQDQQKRMLELLVNPKKYMGGGGDELSGGMGAMQIGGGDKKSPAAPPRSAGSSKPHGKAESPRKESGKSKLFSFGKKSTPKSPTSPPPVGKLK